MFFIHFRNTGVPIQSAAKLPIWNLALTHRLQVGARPDPRALKGRIWKTLTRISHDELGRAGQKPRPSGSSPNVPMCGEKCGLATVRGQQKAVGSRRLAPLQAAEKFFLCYAQDRLRLLSMTIPKGLHARV